MFKKKKLFLIFLTLTFLSLALFLIDLFTGSVIIPFRELFRFLFIQDDGSTNWLMLHEFRLPRVLTAVIAGIALSVSGLQMQNMFRNPLAGPYVLGISSGAGLAVALVVMGLPGIFSYSVLSSGNSWVLIIAAWLGSGFILFLILLFSLRIKNIMTILILGVMIGSGISAIISILQYFSQEAALKAFVVWTMGSLSAVGQEQIPFLAAGFFPGFIISILIIKPSNAILLGENYAKTMGVNLRLYRVFVFISTSLLTGSVTAFCGPIGFVGIAVPHIARLITNTSRSGVLLFASVLIGCIIMLFSDIVSQLPGAQGMLPLNAVTSLIGIPVVIWIVVGKRNIHS